MLYTGRSLVEIEENAQLAQYGFCDITKVFRIRGVPGTGCDYLCVWLKCLYASAKVGCIYRCESADTASIQTTSALVNTAFETEINVHKIETAAMRAGKSCSAHHGTAITRDAAIQ